MPDPDRREAERLLRKNQNTLVIVGKGVIAFGVWSAVKVVLSAMLMEDFQQTLKATTDTGEPVPPLAVYATLTVMLLLLLGFRVLIGRSAIAEGRGRKSRWLYLVLAGLLALIDLAALVGSFVWIKDSYKSVTDLVVTVVVELTSIVTRAELVLSAIRVKRLTRLLGEGG